LPNDNNGVAMLKTNPISEKSTNRKEGHITPSDNCLFLCFSSNEVEAHFDNSYIYESQQTVSEGVSSTVRHISLSDVTDRLSLNTLSEDVYDTAISPQNSVGECLNVASKDVSGNISESNSVNDCLHTTSEYARNIVIVQSFVRVTSYNVCFAKYDVEWNYSKKFC